MGSNYCVILVLALQFCVARSDDYRGGSYGGGINCEDVADGNYADPRDQCSNSYITCSGAVPWPSKCPGKLFFDPESNICDKKQHIPACGGTKPVISPPVAFDDVTVPESTFDCSDKEDGYYANPSDSCSSIYYSCTGGVARELSCQDGLVFDYEAVACELKDIAYVCTGIRPTQAPQTYNQAKPQPNYPMDCQGKADGLYPDPTSQCSHTFYVCAHGSISMSTCAGSTYFDTKNQICDFWQNVYDCTGVEKPASDDLASYQPAPKYADFDCWTLPSGSYADPTQRCNNHYFVCAGGVAYEMTCPESLYWDPDESLCNTRDEIYACTGTTKSPTTPSTTTLFVPSDIPTPEYDCSDKEDGYYLTTQCTNFYYVCANNYDFKLFCPEGLYFDAESHKCLNYMHVFECSGQRGEPTYPTMPPNPTTEAVPIDCHNLQDGDYVDPESACSQVYYSCSGGHGFKRVCAGNTFFDSELNLCDIYDNVPQCSGHEREVTTPQPARDVEIHPFDCSKKFNGIFPAGDCETHYWSCVGGVTYKTDCPFGLRYDIEMNVCDLKVYVPGCGGQRTTPSVLSPYQQPKSDQGTSYQQRNFDASPSKRLATSQKRKSSRKQSKPSSGYQSMPIAPSLDVMPTLDMNNGYPNSPPVAPSSDFEQRFEMSSGLRQNPRFGPSLNTKRIVDVNNGGYPNSPVAPSLDAEGYPDSPNAPSLDARRTINTPRRTVNTKKAEGYPDSPIAPSLDTEHRLDMNNGYNNQGQGLGFHLDSEHHVDMNDGGYNSQSNVPSFDQDGYSSQDSQQYRFFK